MDDLLDIYCKQIRSLLEYAAPVWNSALTGEDVTALERVQKIVLHIILGDEYSSYSSALKTTGLTKLSVRRRKLSLNFAKKAQKNPKFTNWFLPNPKIGGRIKQPQFCPAVAKTSRFQKSPICDLINILNSKSWLWIIVAVNYSGIGRWSQRHCIPTCSVSFSVPLITRQIKQLLLLLLL